MTDLSITVLATFAYATYWFAISQVKRRSDHADVMWGGLFIVLSIVSFLLGTRTPLSLLVTSMVVIWGLRLSIHIYLRNKGKSEDARYLELKSKWGQVTPLGVYGRIFLLQAALSVIVAWPVLLANLSPSDTNVSIFILLGTAAWLTGLCVESVADFQLSKFIKTRAGKKRIMQEGLWRYSRHPNYFGELLCWWGIWLIVLPLPGGWMSVVGPAAISYLILGVSGVPLLEKRYHNDPEYKSYTLVTSKLIPLPSKRNAQNK